MKKEMVRMNLHKVLHSMPRAGITSSEAAERLENLVMKFLAAERENIIRGLTAAKDTLPPVALPGVQFSIDCIEQIDAEENEEHTRDDT